MGIVLRGAARALQGRNQLLDGDRRVSKDAAKDAAKGARSNLVVKWNGNGQPLRVGRMAKADVAAFLTDGDIAKLANARISSSPETTGSFGLIA